MHRRLYKYLCSNNLIYDKQFGFRKNHSTIDAVINSINMIRMENGNDNYVIGIFYDLSKAFDTVNHKILLKKLHNYGIRGITLKWFESYLTSRFQYTVVNSSASAVLPISIGVPQGSILGPLLLTIYLNDLQFASKNPVLTLFADDSNAFVRANDLANTFELATMVCSKMSIWFKCNLLSVNYNKTSYMLFYPTKKDEEEIALKMLNVSKDGMLLERVDCIKFLGLYIDEF